MAIWLVMVPLGQNRAASTPNRSAAFSCRWLTVGSSPRTSSPTAAAAMASSMRGVGRVTVSLLRSIMAVHCSGVIQWLHGWRAGRRSLLWRFLLLSVRDCKLDDSCIACGLRELPSARQQEITNERSTITIQSPDRCRLPGWPWRRSRRQHNCWATVRRLRYCSAPGHFTGKLNSDRIE